MPTDEELYYRTSILVLFPGIAGAIFGLVLFYPAASGEIASVIRMWFIVCNSVAAVILLSCPWFYMKDNDGTILQRILVTLGSCTCFGAIELLVWNKAAQFEGVTVAPGLLPDSALHLIPLVLIVAVGTVVFVCMKNIRSAAHVQE